MNIMYNISKFRSNKNLKDSTLQSARFSENFLTFQSHKNVFITALYNENALNIIINIQVCMCMGIY